MNVLQYVVPDITVSSEQLNSKPQKNNITIYILYFYKHNYIYSEKQKIVSHYKSLTQ